MALQPLPRRARPRLTRRGRASLRVLAGVLLVAAIVIGAVALRTDDEPTIAEPAAATVSTPLWSARRVPYLFVDDVAQQRLTVAATAVADPHEACLTIDDGNAARGLLVRAGDDTALAPASTTKLLTAAAALHALGAAATLSTQVQRDGSTLYVVGGGDPVFATDEYATGLAETPRTSRDVVHPLRDLADAIIEAGLDGIDTIVVDDSHHEDVGFLPGWRESYRDDIGELDALTVDDGFDAGVRVADPALLFGEELRALLSVDGLTVERGTAPDDADDPNYAAVISPEIGPIVSSMLRSSDNLTAELLVREIGGDGTTAAGLQRIVSALDELGVPTAGLELHDGSGLDPANRVTCDAIVAVLALGLPDIDAGLAVAGESGTLVARFLGDPLAGNLRAKTGQINGVAGLAGTIDSNDLDFAYIVNGDFTTIAGQALQVEAARAVASYPDAPPAAELVPLP